MSWWNAKYKNNHGEYEITFGTKYYERAKAVEKVCKAVIDKVVKTPDDVQCVVRCANCIHWVTDDLGNHVCEVFDIANSYGEPVATKPDDFCSYGEKKEEA